MLDNYIDTMIFQEEILDESQNLEELQPFCDRHVTIQLVKKKGDPKTKTLDKNLNHVLGRGKTFIQAQLNL